jgi:hypothetical protein
MNFITILLTGMFVLPVLAGTLAPFPDGVGPALRGFVKRLELPVCLLLSYLSARLLFSHPQSGLPRLLYRLVPPMTESVAGQDIWLFCIAALVFLAFFRGALRLAGHFFLFPLLSPVFDAVTDRYRSMGAGARRLLGGAVRLPRAAALVAAFSLLFHLYIAYAKNTALGDYIGQSAAYRMVSGGIVEPFLDWGLSNSAPDLFDGLLDQAADSTSLRRLPSVTYINGVILQDAVRSNDALDALARELTAGNIRPSEKAYLLYLWVCENISFDFESLLCWKPSRWRFPRCALEAYAARSGVCFDYSCLYVCLCGPPAWGCVLWWAWDTAAERGNPTLGIRSTIRSRTGG